MGSTGERGVPLPPMPLLPTTLPLPTRRPLLCTPTSTELMPRTTTTVSSSAPARPVMVMPPTASTTCSSPAAAPRLSPTPLLMSTLAMSLMSSTPATLSPPTRLPPPTSLPPLTTPKKLVWNDGLHQIYLFIYICDGINQNIIQEKPMSLFGKYMFIHLSEK